MYAIDGSFVNVDTSLFIMVLPKIKRARKANFPSLETRKLLEMICYNPALPPKSPTREMAANGEFQDEIRGVEKDYFEFGTRLECRR